MTDDDAPPTDEELAEAEALARALEGPGASGSGAAAPGSARPAPEDALAAAALLRHARAPASEGARAPAGAAARALAALAARRPSRARPRARWLVPTVLVSCGAAAMVMSLYLVTRSPSEWSAGRAPLPLPAPSVALLRAQARAASGGQDLGALDRDMRAYRAAFYAALATREGDGR